MSLARNHPVQRFFGGRSRALLSSVICGDGRGLTVGSLQSFRWQLLSRASRCSSQLRQGWGGSFPGLLKMIMFPCEVFGIISSLRSYTVRF